jgi:hypothetical protein
MRRLLALLAAALHTNAAFAPQPNSMPGVVRTASSKKVDVETPAWHVATANAWKRLLSNQMGKREFVGSRAKRIAMKVNPLTQCVTDEECLLEIEESGEFFEEPPLDRAETLS